MNNDEYIEALEEKLRLETERADRNYDVAVHFENLYDELVDWLVEEDHVE